MIPVSERTRLVDSPCWLNDEPARVTGWANEFAHVVQLGSGLSAEWAWETVKRVIDNRGGRFYT